MLAKDIKIGQRVRVLSNDLTALIVGDLSTTHHVQSLCVSNMKTALVMNI